MDNNMAEKTGFGSVAIIGLGLIGGSMAKTIKNRTDCRVYALNRNRQVSVKAKEEGVIDDILLENVPLDEADLVILALYPDVCIEFVLNHLSDFKKGAVIVDCCGTKQKICNALYKPCAEAGVSFIGGHPMAGVEKSGYDASFEGMFDNASMILCKLGEEQSEDFKRVKEFFLKLGFGFIKETTPAEHDRVIAYTSQMAHVVSNAYIKSEACKIRYGFSAGSFKDLTRVAYLNETMWTELFMENKESLVPELKELMGHLQEYIDALEAEDEEELCKLLRDGRICKTDDIRMEEEQDLKRKQ